MAGKHAYSNHAYSNQQVLLMLCYAVFMHFNACHTLQLALQ